MIRAKTILLILLAMVTTAPGQSNITGQYLDQLGNEIEDARVRYYMDGEAIDSTITDISGLFELQVPALSVSDAEQLPNTYSLNQNYPNPFNPTTRINASTLEPASIVIYNILGQAVDHVKLPSAGKYSLSWGGGNASGKAVSAGIYFYVLRAGDNTKIRKMTLLDHGNGSRLGIVAAQGIGADGRLLKSRSLDELVFTKFNTTELRFSLETPTADTSLGIITGNVGPTILSDPPDTTIAVGDSLYVNFNDFIYNDDSTNYEIAENGLELDSVFFINPVAPDTFNYNILAIDGTDHTLSDTLSFTVYIPYVNQPPVQIAAIPDTVTAEDISLEIVIADVFVNDPEGDDLVFTIDSLNGNYATTGISVTITPVENFHGLIENIVINVSDGFDNIILTPFSITVTPVNDPPTALTPIPDQSFGSGQPVVLDMQDWVFDVDNDALIYSVNLDTSLWTATNNELVIHPNGVSGNVIISASDSEYTVDLDPFSITLSNLPPVILGIIPDATLTTDYSSYGIDKYQYFSDPDGDPLTYSVNLPAENVSDEPAYIWIFPNPSGPDTLENVIITVSDPFHSVDANPFTVYSPGFAPELILEIEDTVLQNSIVFVLNAENHFYSPPNSSHPDGVPMQFSVNLLPDQATVDDSIISIYPDFGQPLDSIIVTAITPGFSIDSNPFSVSIEMDTVNVHFVMKDFFTDSVLVTDTSTWWVGDSVYYTTNGELDLLLPAGEYEFNATNPNTADGASPVLEDYYTFLRKDGEIECFEVRGRDDYSSPIPISENDTIKVYKLMQDGPFVQGLLLYVSSIGTVRFPMGDYSQDAWVNLNYQTPSALSLQRLNHIYNVLRDNTEGKLNLQHTEGTTTPTEPYMGIAINGVGPVNSTSFNANNEITFCGAQFPLPLISGVVAAYEVTEATTYLQEAGGNDAPIFEIVDNQMQLNDLGKKLIKFIYFVPPGTKL